MFIVRHQGFFYTDEFFAPSGAYRQKLRRTFETREAAEEACRAQARVWIRRERLGDYIFAGENRSAHDAVIAYMKAEWPEEHGDLDWRTFYDSEVPDEATDAQVDEILRRGAVVMAEVFEVDAADAEEPVRERGEDDEDGGDEGDDLYYGPG